MSGSRAEIAATDLCALRLIAPVRAGQRRVVRINTRQPIFVELEAVEIVANDVASLQWKTLTIVSEEGALHSDVSSLPATSPLPGARA